MQFRVKRKAHKVALAWVDAAGALILLTRRETPIPITFKPNRDILERKRP